MSILVIAASQDLKERFVRCLTSSTEIEESIRTNLVPIRTGNSQSVLVLAPENIEGMESIVLQRSPLILIVWDVENSSTLSSMKEQLFQICGRVRKSFRFLVIGITSENSSIQTGLLTLNSLSDKSIENIRTRIHDALFEFRYPFGVLSSM